MLIQILMIQIFLIWISRFSAPIVTNGIFNDSRVMPNADGDILFEVVISGYQLEFVANVFGFQEFLTKKVVSLVVKLSSYFLYLYFF